MTDNTPATGARAHAVPPVDFTQEIRFAVVMYGGSSLAIYMNGVAQELLRLVRSTAPADADMLQAHLSDEELKGSERVYRKLGRMLKRGDGDGLTREERLKRAEGTGALLTRFVVDVLTGTSAGGINAVFLAKALANDQQLDKLMALWKEKGDIGVLLNVPPSSLITVGGVERALDFEGQPASPLNSSRMYWELLDAIRGMDEQQQQQGAASPPLYAEELDLYVTATDTRGRIINMRLADKVVQERRHRNVFHFRYRRGEGEEQVNDFTPRYNPFLAFAARCTSAHQAAFEVMNMQTADKIIEGTDGTRPPELGMSDPHLRKFFEQYLAPGVNSKLWERVNGRPVMRDGKPVELRPEELGEDELRELLAEDFFGRFFNDGGTLDNSPFSFVSDVLPFRQTMHPVDRKLLYVEPAPEHPDEEGLGNARWNFVKNAAEGVSTLPSYQTIVEDLDRIQDRNQLVERVNHILTDLREDIRARNLALYEGNWPELHKEDMRDLKLSELIKSRGVSWGGYQRLRIAQVTNDLTLLVARAAGLDEQSDEFMAVRYLVRRWRLGLYEDHVGEPDSACAPPPAAGAGQAEKQPEINFLLDFDLGWTIRRVQFVLRTIDELDCLDASACRIAEIANQRDVKIKWPGGEAGRSEFRDELRRVRHEVNGVYSRLRAARRRFWARRDVEARPGERRGGGRYLNPFRDRVDALGVSKKMLLDFLACPTEKARDAMLSAYLSEQSHSDAFKKLSHDVKTEFDEEVNASRDECKRLLDFHDEEGRLKLDDDGRLGLEESVRYVLFFYYKFFEDYDQVSFPVFYSTDVGEETDPIEVFRVSPEDACLLVDEKAVNNDRPAGVGRINKLAGTTLGHFGAFFDERYRVNDILWGRLDGAERIISALLPGGAGPGADPCDPDPGKAVNDNEYLRKTFVRQAHEEIILETWERTVSGLEDPALAREADEAMGQEPRNDARLRRLEGRLKERGVPALWRRFFSLNAGRGRGHVVEDFKQAFLDSYAEERKYPLLRKLALAGRGTGVLTKILHANLREDESGLKPLLRLAVGLGLTVAGLWAFVVGLIKTVGGVLRLILSPLRKSIDKVNAGTPS